MLSGALINFNLLMGDWKSIQRWDLARRPDYVAGSDHNLSIALALKDTTKPSASIAVESSAVHHLQEGMHTMAMDGTLRSELAAKGLRRAKYFTWMGVSDSSRRSASLKPCRANLLAQYTLWPGNPRAPSIEPT